MFVYRSESSNVQFNLNLAAAGRPLLRLPRPTTNDNDHDDDDDDDDGPSEAKHPLDQSSEQATIQPGSPTNRSLVYLRIWEICAGDAANI